MCGISLAGAGIETDTGGEYRPEELHTLQVEDLPDLCDPRGHLQFSEVNALLMMLYNSLNLDSGIIRAAKSALGTSIPLLGPSSELDLIAVRFCLADGAGFRG